MIKIVITKNDALNVLFDLKDKGVDVSTPLGRCIKYGVTLDTIRFICDNMELEVRKFYEKIRKSHNNNNSKLYMNIVKGDLEPIETMCCLGALQQQILLFYKGNQDRAFLRHARFVDITKCMQHFYHKGDTIPAQQLLSLIRSDLKVLEYLSNNDESNVINIVEEGSGSIE